MPSYASRYAAHYLEQGNEKVPMRKEPKMHRHGFLDAATWFARVISLPGSLAHSDNTDLHKFVEWLPAWALFVVIPLAVAAALAVGFWLVGQIPW